MAHVTDVNIVSDALILLGHNSISAFNESEAGRAGEELYEITLDSLLTMHPWRFAIGKVALSKLAAAPLNEWQFAYQLPTDPKFLRLIKTYPGGIGFEIYEDTLYANVDGVSIDYMFRPNEEDFPPHFVELLTFRMAQKLAIPVTDNRTFAEEYRVAFTEQLGMSMSIDAGQRPNDAIVDSPFTDVRP